MNKLLKIVFGLTLVLALVIGVGAVKASAETAPSAGLTMGSTGQAVTDLQNALISLGYSIPAGATGYFGSQTAAAVSAFQNAYASEVLAPIGLTSGTGFYGSLSAAKLASVLVGGSSVVGGTWPSGCTSGSGYSSTTGMPCTSTTTYPAGCTSSAGFSVTTGDSCSTTTTTTTTYPEGCTSAVGYSSTTGTKCDTTAPATPADFDLEGGAGSAVIDSSSVAIETEVREKDANRKILGFRVEAQGGDLEITNVMVNLNRTGTSAIGQLSNYVKKVSILMDGEVVGSADASAFTKSSNSYTKTIALSGAVVKELVANRKTFYVAVDAVDSLVGYTGGTPQWTVTASNVRVNDATGAIVTTSTWTGNSATRSFTTLATSGVVKLKIARGAASPSVGNVTVSETSSTPDILLNEFTLKAEGSDIFLTDIAFTIATSTNNVASVASDFKLKRKDGSSWMQIADWTATNTSPVTATLYDELKINKDATETFQVYARINTATTTNYAAGASLTVNYSNATVEDASRNTISPSNKQGSANGEAQSFYSEGITVSDFSASTPVATTNTSGDRTKETFKFTFKVGAFGREFWIPDGLYNASNTADSSVTTAGLALFPTNSGATSTMGSSISMTSLSATGGTATGNLTGNRWPIQANTYRTFEATVDIASSATTTAKYWRIQLANVRYASGSGDPLYTPLQLAPAQNYRTAEAKID